MTSSRKCQNAPLPQLHGVIVLDKPSGPTSARCLAALKRLGQKKIGHAGTLDPMASGVLLVLLGNATKIASHLLADGGKVYGGALRLGRTTDTWDREGRVIAEAPWDRVTPEQVRAAVAGWRGVSEQPVPPYSAAKHQGTPLYRLARRGQEAPQKVKRIEISHAEALEIALPYVRFRVACSSGTYIRSLAHSLGMRLGCGAVLTELIREYSYPFGLDMACGLDAVMEDPPLLERSLRPIAEALPRWLRVTVTAEEAARVRNGVAIPCRHEGDRALLLERGAALALAQRTETAAGSCWAVLRGLWN